MTFRRFSIATIAIAIVSLAAALPLTAQHSTQEGLGGRDVKKREAIEHYLRAKLYAQDSEFEEAVKEFRRAVELDPDDAGLRREYAELLRDLPVYADAEREARKAVELAPSNAGARRILGQILLATAKDRKDVEAAAAELKRANDAQPNEPTGAVSY